MIVAITLFIKKAIETKVILVQKMMFNRRKLS